MRNSAFRRRQPGHPSIGAGRPGARPWLISLLVFALLAGGCSPPPPLRVGSNQWVGYEGLYLARSLGHYDPTLIKLVELPSSTEVQQALRDGLLEAGALTLDETLSLVADGIELSVVLVMDISHGGDAVLAAPSLGSLADLAGRRVGAETSGVGAVVLDGALTAGGLARSDITLVPMTADRHMPALLDGKVDAVVTFEPQRTQLEKAGYRVLFDSRQIPGRIVDVLALRSAALRTHGPALRELLSGYFRALEYLAVDPQGAHRRMGQRLEVPAEDIPAMLTGIRLPDEAENRELLHGTPAPLNRSAAELIAVMRRADILADGPHRPLATTARFLPR